jgi:PTH1 family peptidyl-tRNA hydrolase
MNDRAMIVGLGNPGREYAKNRHNVGFQIVDHLAERHGLSFTRQQSKAFIAAGAIHDRQVLLVKPQGYMNVSGEPVGAITRFYKIALENILVIFDDLDLPVGTLRMRPNGGAGGQNGMKSIIQHLKSQDFARLRVGIGRPPGRMKPKDYVLQDFKGDQIPIIQETYDRASDAAETWLSDGVQLAMSRHNGPAPE